MKMGLREISPALFNFIRLPVVILILSVLVWQREGMPELARLNRRQVTRAAVAGILEQDVGMVLSFMAIQMIGVAKTALLIATSPLFVAPLAVIFLKEKVTWRVVLGTLLCVSGIWLIV
jgi:transporter family protein